MDRVIIFCDGSWDGKNRRGGIGAIVINRTRERMNEISAAYHGKHSVRMELAAAVHALGSLKRPSLVDLYTDAVYVIQHSSKHRQNNDLWDRMEELLERHHVAFYYVPSKSGDQMQHHAHVLAQHGSGLRTSRFVVAKRPRLTKSLNVLTKVIQTFMIFVKGGKSTHELADNSTDEGEP